MRPVFTRATILILVAALPPIACTAGNNAAPTFERVGHAVLADGSPDLAAYSKLAPWPYTDDDYLYSGCYPHAPLPTEPGAGRCFMIVNLSVPERPVRSATIHAFDETLSPPPPADHPVWRRDYPWPNLPVGVPCQVDWLDPEIVNATRPPTCWDPGWNTQTHYVAAVPGRLLAVNMERFRYGSTRQPNRHGVRFYDISTPARPELLSEWDAPVSPPDAETGVYQDARGVHHFNFHGDYLYVGTEYEGYIGKILVILDVSDPHAPREVGKWWLPGQKTPEEDSVRDWVQQPLFSRPVRELEGGKFSRHVGMHYVTVNGTTAYLAYHQAGLVLLDVADPTAPKLFSRINYLQPGAEPLSPNVEQCRRAAQGQSAACGNTHTARLVPGTRLLMVEDEYFTCPFGHVRIFDVENPQAPRLLGQLVLPETLACDPAIPMQPADKERFPLRGPSAHLGNAWNERIYLTAWYGLGLQAFDYSDPSAPRHIAGYTYKISDDLPTQDPRYGGSDTYDVIMGPEGLIYVSDGTAGLRVLRLNNAKHYRR
ncbi:MAG: hypothetical protein WD448_03225 [Woeseia sp.]